MCFHNHVSSAGPQKFICCTNIVLPSKSHRTPNEQKLEPLFEIIESVSQSDPTNLSWCAKSEEVCLDQLNGQVSWIEDGRSNHHPDSLSLNGQNQQLNMTQDEDMVQTGKAMAPTIIPVIIGMVITLLLLTLYVVYAWSRFSKDKRMKRLSNRSSSNS